MCKGDDQSLHGSALKQRLDEILKGSSSNISNDDSYSYSSSSSLDNVSERSSNASEIEEKSRISQVIANAEKKAVKQNQPQNIERQDNAFRTFALDNLDVRADRLRVNIPAKTVLQMSYGTAFADRINDKKRKENQRNRRSRLYQKKANADLLAQNVKLAHDFAYYNAKKLIGENVEINENDYDDLAQFLVSGNIDKNKELVDLMLGGRNAQGKPCVDEEHAKMALVKMANQLLFVDLSTIKIDTDRDIAENGAKLEALANRIAAFTRLSQRYNFFESLDNEQKKAINDKLFGLKMVSEYYLIRKQIISDKLYKEHYDDELTMDISKARTDEQNALAQKLVISYAIGKNMMSKLGVPVKNTNKISIPKFGTEQALYYFDQAMEYYAENKAKNFEEEINKNYEETLGNNVSKNKEIPEDDWEDLGNYDNQSMVYGSQVKAPQKLTAKEKVDRAEFKLKEEDYVYANLLSAKELEPLADTKELKAVENTVKMLNAMLMNTMPDAGNTQEFDGSLLSITMIYTRLVNDIDNLIFKCGNDYTECSNMLKGIQAQAKNEGESFREKTIEYLKLAGNDANLSQKKHTWMDAFKFNRAVFYNLDDKNNLSYEMDGAGASLVYKIKRKVPKTKDNPTGVEIVYFRKKDNMPPEGDDALLDSVFSKYTLQPEIADAVKGTLAQVMQNPNFTLEVHHKITIMKQNKNHPTAIGREISDFLKKRTALSVRISLDELEVLGKIYTEWHDTYGKREIGNGKRLPSAKIGFNRNLSDRNVATSRLATLLGMQDMICDSRTATICINGQMIEGNLMDATGGVETNKGKAKAYSTKAISQLFQLQIFDFICGQIDRHFGNFHGILDKKGNIDQIRCLDNDMAFGKLKPQEIARGYNRIPFMSPEALLGLPKNFVDRIMALNRSYIVQIMGDILQDDEIKALMERIDAIKQAIANMADKFDGVNWDKKKKKINYTGAMADDQYRALFALKGIKNLAARNKVPVFQVSKFYDKNLAVTPLDKMMDERKKIIDRKDGQ